jgi:hypothetical protein
MLKVVLAAVVLLPSIGAAQTPADLQRLSGLAAQSVWQDTTAPAPRTGETASDLADLLGRTGKTVSAGMVLPAEYGSTGGFTAQDVARLSGRVPASPGPRPAMLALLPARR